MPSNRRECFTTKSYLVSEVSSDGFCTPIFYRQKSKTPYVAVSEDDVIVEFRQFILDDNERVEPLDWPIQAGSGDKAVWVYRTTSNKVLAGTLSDIEVKLSSQLKTLLSHDPFIALQVAEVLGDESSTKAALDQITSASEYNIPKKHRSMFITSFARDYVWRNALSSISDIEHRLETQKQIGLLRVQIETGGRVTVTDLSGGRLVSEQGIQYAAERATKLLKVYLFDDAYGHDIPEQTAELILDEQSNEDPIDADFSRVNDPIVREILRAGTSEDQNLLRPLVNISRAKVQETRFALLLLLMLTKSNQIRDVIRLYRDRAEYPKKMLAHIERQFLNSKAYYNSDFQKFVARNIGHFCSQAYYGNRGRLLFELARILYMYPEISNAIRARAEQSQAFDIAYLKADIIEQLNKPG